MTHLIRNMMLLAALSGLVACAGVQPKPVVIKNTDDPLIDTIYHADGPARISKKDLFNRMVRYDVIYLGENHDNTHQHKAQLDTIKALVARGLKPAIGFEFFSREQTSRLIQFINSADKYHAKDSVHSAEMLLRDQIGWGANRDDDWAHLFPILQYARQHKLTVFGADLSAALRKQISKLGYDALSAVEKLQAPVSDFANDAYREYMYQSFTLAHCGWRNEGYLEKLYETWLLRNEAMAQSIVVTYREQPEQPVVMILGGGHTEYNMAVYERVANLEPDLLQLNLRLRTVGAEPAPVGEFFKTLSIDEQYFGVPYAYNWFTARMPEREDPCKAFLKYKNKHGKQAKQHQPTAAEK